MVNRMGNIPQPQSPLQLGDWSAWGIEWGTSPKPCPQGLWNVLHVSDHLVLDPSAASSVTRLNDSIPTGLHVPAGDVTTTNCNRHWLGYCNQVTVVNLNSTDHLLLLHFWSVISGLFNLFPRPFLPILLTRKFSHIVFKCKSITFLLYFK